MTEEVINIDQVEQDAFYLGTEYGPMGEEGLNHFRDFATYSNEVLPELRRMAGYEDAGAGTYQVAREVEATADDADYTFEVSTSELLSRAVDAFDRGVTHGLDD